MKSTFVSLFMLLVAVSCNQTDLTSDFFENDQSTCFDTALLLSNSSDMGKLPGITYGKGICYKGSVALDNKESFYTEAVVVNHLSSKKMYASYIFRNANGLFVKDEQGLSTKIGEIDYSIAEVAIKLLPQIKTQVVWEENANGIREQVLILELNGPSQI